MIRVRSASKSFGKRSLWSDVSFDVASGEMLALVGPSGSGKSTLLNCIGMLEPLDGGRIFVGDHDVTRFSRGQRRRFRRDALGYLFQNYALIENASVSHNLDLAAGAGHMLRRRHKGCYEEALERVGLGGRGGETVYQLSGGEQQRVALARILLRRPRVILADEPTGALDRHHASVVIDVLRELSSRGCAVVIATHNADVESSCDATFTVGDESLLGGSLIA